MSGINKNDKKTLVNFKPRARLLIQLGDQLIKNESIALVELVKNSYDADANKVDIYMENVEDPDNGLIIIEDDGYGDYFYRNNSLHISGIILLCTIS